MTIEIKVPMLPESVTDATIAKWYKKVGDTIARDENLVDLETDKVMLEVPAPKAGEMLAVIKEGSGVVDQRSVQGGASETKNNQAAAMHDESQKQKLENKNP